MSTERTPEEDVADQLERDYVRTVLDEARAAMASWIVADVLDEPPDVCERWIDHTWSVVRDGLTPEQRIHAVTLLLAHDATQDARRIVAEVRS